jgi:hypothetical protein
MALLSGGCKPQVEPGLEAYANVARYEACRPAYAFSWRGEADQFWNSASEASRACCCNDLPFLIISQDPDNPGSGKPVLIGPIWNSLQERLKALSPHSLRIIAGDSGQAVMIDRPNVVIRGIQQVSATATGHDTGSQWRPVFIGRVRRTIRSRSQYPTSGRATKAPVLFASTASTV